MTNLVVADLTKDTSFDLNWRLRTLIQYYDSKFRSGGDGRYECVVIVTKTQAERLEGSAKFRLLEISEENSLINVVSDIEKVVDAHLQKGEASKAYLSSYDKSVWTLPEKIQFVGRLFVIPWSAYNTVNPTATKQKIPSFALNDLKKILAAKSAVDSNSEFYNKHVRPALVDQFGIKYHKTSGETFAQSKTFVADLVLEAIRQGWLMREHDSAKDDYRLWLKDRAHATAVVASPPVREQERERKPPTRSDAFYDSLKARQLGPFAKVRPQLLDAVEHCVVESPSVPALIDAVIDRVRDQEPEHYPWRYVGEFLTHWLSESKVLLDDEGHTLPVSWASLDSKVSSLATDWRSQMESRLLLVLVQEHTDITLSDTDSLAGCLYLTRNEENKNKVRDLVSYLMGRGDIQPDKTTGTLILSTPEALNPNSTGE